MKKIIILLSIIFLIGGCYDYTEIDDINIITGIILDYVDNNYELTTEVLDNNTVKVFKTTCPSIDLCILNTSKKSNKELFISHLKALILTQRTVNKDIKFYDYFLRNSKSKMNFYIYYIDDENKDKLFNNKNESMSLYLKDLLEFNIKNYSNTTKVTFTDMIQNKIENGINNIYPNITIEDNQIKVDSLISFNKNEKIELNNFDSILYNILINNVKSSIINIPCDDNDFSLKINNSKVKYSLSNKLNINIKLDLKLSNYNCKYDLNKKNNIIILEKLTNKYINEKTSDLISLSKNKNIDFIGLSRLIYKKNKTNKKLENIDIDINVQSKILSIGESR